jgi:hypothetical protein
MRLYAAMLLMMFFTGCSMLNYESFYEGTRSQQKANGVVKEPSQLTLPNYQQYEKERNHLKNPR